MNRSRARDTLLDETDIAILRVLQSDAGITNVELARRIGMSPPPCLRRVKALEDAGFIRGYRALIDPARLGYDVTCFAMVHLDSQASPDLDAFVAAVEAWSAVRECWTLSGDIDFMLKIVARDLSSFQQIVADLTTMPNVRNVRTAIAIARIKSEPDVPL